MKTVAKTAGYLSEHQDVVSKKLKNQTNKYLGSLLLTWGGPFLLIGIVIALILLMILIFWIPFLLFSTPGEFNLDAAYETGPSWGNEPKYLDVDGISFSWPTPTLTHLSSSFGDNRGNEIHKGLDIVDPRGLQYTEMQAIYAMAAGTVTRAGAASGYGVAVYIDHGNGLISRYGHLDSMLYVREGEQVQKGQLIARVGRGQVGESSGPHLHFQVELNGVPVQPLDYVKKPVFMVSADIAYRPLQISAAKNWLNARDSALAQDDILRSIDRAAQSQNVSPYLLIAITGQEQSFVPDNHPQADIMVRNPWNVFGCWCSGKGATLSTEESATIAARTVAKLSQDRPSTSNPIQWLVDKSNPRGVYATHSGWWIGVSRFYQAIQKAIPQ